MYTRSDFVLTETPSCAYDTGTIYEVTEFIETENWKWRKTAASTTALLCTLVTSFQDICFVRSSCRGGYLLTTRHPLLSTARICYRHPTTSWFLFNLFSVGFSQTSQIYGSHNTRLIVASCIRWRVCARSNGSMGQRTQYWTGTYCLVFTRLEAKLSQPPPL